MSGEHEAVEPEWLHEAPLDMSRPEVQYFHDLCCLLAPRTDDAVPILHEAGLQIAWVDLPSRGATAWWSGLGAAAEAGSQFTDATFHRADPFRRNAL